MSIKITEAMVIGVQTPLKLLEPFLYVTDSDGFIAPIRFRLYGIDAPEKGQPFYLESKQHLQQALDLADPCSTVVKYHKIDCYGRLLATIIINGININRRMVALGFAWALEGTYTIEQTLAKKRKRGLWSQKSPLPPWEYRKQHPYVPQSTKWTNKQF